MRPGEVRTVEPAARRPFSGVFAEVPQFPGALTDIGQRYQEYEDAETASKDKPGDEGAQLEFENKKLRYQVEATRHDSGTGLLRRGVYFEELERKILADEPATSMFIDLGFLKYFDQKGGREVADAAVRVAADILERAITDSGVNATAFRYAGDEFAVLVEGSVVDAEKIRASIEKLNAERGSIPDLAGLRAMGVGDIPEDRDSAPEYAPSTLVFNIGIGDDEMATEVYADLLRAGAYTGEKELELANPKNRANLKAEIMTKIADTAVARDKAVDRFGMLIAELRSPEYADPEKKKQIDSLIAFSNKAIFAELGGSAALRLFAEESGISSEELAGQIRRFAENRLEFSGTLLDRKRELADQLVELHAEIGHLNGRLTEAQKDNALQGDELKRLRDRLEQAERERKKIIDVRKEVGIKKAA
jgi:GGDEF domain-containing protein